MKLKFNKIKIKNFMSLGEVELVLSDRGFVFVEGVNNNVSDLARSNGAGKSSIFEAILWAITGETSRGIKDVVNINAHDGTVVELDFNVGIDSYTITRSKNDSKLKTNLKIFVNGEDKSGKGIRDSEKLLQEYLVDVTASLISSVIILGQGLPDRFTNNTPSGRKETLEKLCKSDFMIQDLKDRITSRQDSLKVSLREIEDSYIKTSTLKSFAVSKKESSVKLLEDLSSMKNLTEEKSLYESKLESMTSELLKLSESISDLKQVESANRESQQVLLDEYSKNKELVRQKYVNDIENVTSEIVKVKTEQARLINEIKSLESIVDICPTCGQKIIGISKPDPTPLKESLSKVEETLTSLNTDLSHKKTLIDDEIQVLTVKYGNDASELKNQISEVIKEIVSKESTSAQLTSDIRGVESKLAQCNALIESQEELRKKYESDIEEATKEVLKAESELVILESKKDDIDKRLSVISKFSTVVSRDFRGYLLEGVISFINKKAKEYCKYIFETDLLNFAVDGNNISISYCGKEYEALSGGEKQKVDLIVQLSIRDMLCTYANFSSNIIVLDEIFDNLDDIGCNRVINLLSTKLSDISTIFIITHHGGELSIPYDDTITIVKDNSGVSTLR